MPKNNTKAHTIFPNYFYSKLNAVKLTAMNLFGCNMNLIPQLEDIQNVLMGYAVHVTEGTCTSVAQNVGIVFLLKYARLWDSE